MRPGFTPKDGVRLQPDPGASGGSSEWNAVDPATLDANGFELDVELRELRVRREPRLRRARHAARLLGVDHLERMSEGGTAFLLDLDNEQPPTSAQDEVELVPARACVGVEQAVAAKPVVEKSAALAAIHAAS